MYLFNLFFSSKKASLLVFHAHWCDVSRIFLSKLNSTRLNYTLIDVDKDSTRVNKFNIKCVPTCVLIDRKNHIIKKWEGYDEENDSELKSFVTYLNKYKLVKPQL